MKLYKIKTRKANLPAYILFYLIFFMELLAGYYINHVRLLISGDAISRVANAFYVIYVKPQSLAAIGFVWNPLLSLMELPLMFIWPLYHEIASSGLAGVIITSLFAGLTASMLFNAFMSYSHSTSFSIFATLMYVLNPYIFLYGLNGMTEVVYNFMVIWSIVTLLKWMQDRNSHHIMKIALALALAFLTRYEAVTFTMGIALCITLILIFSKKELGLTKIKILACYYHIEASLIVLLTPVLFAVFVWITCNYIITGNALYFLNSKYSNLGQSGNILNDNNLTMILNRPLKTLEYILGKISFFIVPFIFVVLKRIFTGKLLKKDFLILVILIVFSEIMQYFLLLKGKSASFIRYFMYPFPVLIAWLPYELRDMKKKILKYIYVFTMLIITSAITLYILINPTVAQDQYNIFDDLGGNVVVKSQMEVAEYINKNHPDSIILMDTFKTFSIFLSSKNPYNFIVSSSLKFTTAIKYPKESGVEFIIIPEVSKESLGYIDAINSYYPELYENGADWCVLEKEFKSYKVYRVK